VRGSFAERAAWLAAIALVAFAAALAITRRGGDENESLPAAVVVPGTKTGYYTAKAAPYGPTARRSRTACGQPLLETTEGVAHPVLPCGVRLYVRFNGREVLTQVVDQAERPGARVRHHQGTRGPARPARHADHFLALRALTGQLGYSEIARPCSWPAHSCRTNTTAKGASVRSRCSADGRHGTHLVDQVHSGRRSRQGGASRSPARSRREVRLGFASP